MEVQYKLLKPEPQYKENFKITFTGNKETRQDIVVNWTNATPIEGIREVASYMDFARFIVSDRSGNNFISKVKDTKYHPRVTIKTCMEEAILYNEKIRIRNRMRPSPATRKSIGI